MKKTDVMKPGFREMSITCLIALSVAFLSSCAHVGQQAPGSARREGSAYGWVNPYEHFLLGLAYEEEGRFMEAVGEFLAALQEGGESVEVYRSLGFNYLVIDDHQSSLRYIDLGLALAPEDGDLLLLGGMCRYELGHDDDAIEMLGRCLAASEEPRSKCDYLLGNLYFRRNDPMRALEYYLRYVEKAPGNAEVWYRMGILYEELGNLSEGKRAYNRAILSNPFDLRPYLEMGRIHEHEGDDRAALFYYRKVLATNPEDSRIHKKMGDLYLRLGDTEQAIESYREVLGFSPGDTPVRYLLALLHFKAKDFIEAQNEFQILLGIDPENPEYNLYMGKIFLQRQLYTEALSFFRISETHAKGDMQVEIQREKAATYLLNMEYDKAAAAIYGAVELNPGDGSLHYIAGLIEIERENGRGAMNCFEKAIERGFENDYLRFTLGTMYYDFGEYEKAGGSFRRAIELNEENSSAYNYIAYMYAEQGVNLDDALELITKALALEPDNGSFIDSLGWIYYKMGEPLKALEELTRASALIDEDPVIFDHLGDVYYTIGEFEKARDNWEKSIEMDESKIEIRDKLRKLDAEGWNYNETTRRFWAPYNPDL